MGHIIDTCEGGEFEVCTGLTMGTKGMGRGDLQSTKQRGGKKGIKGGPVQSRPAARETVDSGNQLKPQGVCVHVCLRIRHAVLDGALASGEMQRWLTPTLVALI